MAKNHYFSDITELFLKAKEEENIEPDPHMKTAVREMLVYKINEMKAAPEPRGSFFNKWKFQLIGVPASLFGLVLIVFAATNLQFSFPKEDFTPTTEKEPMQEVEMVIEESVVEPEKDRPVVKTAEKPDLLTLEFGDEGDSPTRTLKKIPVVSTRGGEEEVVVVEEPAAEELAVKTVFKPEIDEPKLTSPVFIVAPEEEPQPKVEEPAESLDQDIPTEPAEEPIVEKVEPIEIPVEPITNDQPETKPLTKLPTTIAPLEEKPLVVDYTEDAQEFVEKVEMQEETFDVFYYRDSRLLTEPIFDKEQIIKLTGVSEPSAVNVYYTEEKQVVVEVKENGTSKWYLFANVNDTWTIQKYEKQILENVVK